MLSPGTITDHFSQKTIEVLVILLSALVDFKGAWWYNNCHSSNLNGHYLRGDHIDGVTWGTWKRSHSLKTTIMMIKPVG